MTNLIHHILESSYGSDFCVRCNFPVVMCTEIFCIPYNLPVVLCAEILVCGVGNSVAYSFVFLYYIKSFVAAYQENRKAKED